MTKLAKLSLEQEALMPIVVREWIESALSPHVYSEEEVRKAAAGLYSICKLKPNPKVLLVASPLAIQYAHNILKNQVANQVRNQVWNQVENQVRNQVENQVWNQVRNQVENQVENQVANQVRNQVENQVKNQVKNKVENQVENQVWNQVENQVENQVKNQVKNKVRNQVKNQVENQAWNQVRNQVANQVKNQVKNQVENQKLEYVWIWSFSAGDAGWQSFYDYFTRIKAINVPEFTKLTQIQNKWFAAAFYEQLVICCPNPAILKRDDANRLHSTSGMAISWLDGYGQHYIHGIYFSPDDFNKFFGEKKATAQEVISLKDSDQRAAVIQEYGIKNLLESMPELKVLDEYRTKSMVDGQPCTYQVLEFKFNERYTHRVVRVECHTTHDITILGVPRIKETENSIGAISWTFGMEANEYAPEKET